MFSIKNLVPCFFIYIIFLFIKWVVLILPKNLVFIGVILNEGGLFDCCLMDQSPAY